MRGGRRIALAAGVAVVAACARAPKPAAEAATPPAPQVPPDTDTVSLERGPCFGTCPVYRVSLDRAGNVRFEGHRFVADSGISTAIVPREQAESLFVELETADYFDFADSYRSGDPVCTRYATDLPTVITEVHLRGRTKRVEHDRGCADAPAALSALETRIDEVTGVGRWTGK